MHPNATLLDSIPGEIPLADILQHNVQFILGKKTVKSGKLILFKRVHYCLQITMMNSKQAVESFEIPIPYKTEYYADQGIIYFDYRIISLSKRNKDIEKRLRALNVKNVVPSQYYDKILEINITDI